MLISGTSQYLLKRVRAKAKMIEYHIPPELHGKMEEESKYLLILAIATIGDFSNDIVDSFRGKACDYEEHKKNLQFTSVFFDAYLDAQLCEGNQEYYLLLGAVVYYLCDCNGSSKVLADQISDNVNLGVQEIDRVLIQILQCKDNVICTSRNEGIKDLVEEYNYFLHAGRFSGFEKLLSLKAEVYKTGTNRELLFMDALVATVYLKVQHSAYVLMPEYTQINSDIWQEILNKGTLITELWQAQRKLGEAGVFAGKSATIQMPTSSGKTKSVALIILSSFLRRTTNCAIVVAPFRSLCREITDELKMAFSYTDRIHINEISDVMQMDFLDMLIGNKEVTEDKNVYIVTPEKLLYILRQNITFLSNVGLMIFDEGHLFDDLSRGITYEFLISTIKFYMEEKGQKILISAVIPNAVQVNEWFTNNTGVVIKNNIIMTTEKVVGIADFKSDPITKALSTYLYFINPENPEEEEFFVPRVISQKLLRLHKRESKVRNFPEIDNSEYRNDMAIALSLRLCMNGGVAIFCGKKDTADKILKRILEIEERGVEINSLIRVADMDEIAKLSFLIKEEMGDDNNYYKAACKGAFVHHGSIPMGLRCSVEYAMQHGKINFLACTSTLAQGVNLPIRYLIISNIYQGKERIRVRDFQNLIGRAGRAGIYTEGTILLSETQIYNSRKWNNWSDWKWNNYKQLLNSEQAEACTSVLFSWLRADEGMEEYLDKIIELFEESYITGDFNDRVKQYLEEQKFEHEENYNKAEFMINQMLHNIEAIESFLLFYLMDDTYEESKDIIHDIIKETLAYYMAEKDERERLFIIVDRIGEFLIQAVDTADKRNRYSKSLLGVKKEIEIEQWVFKHIEEIINCRTEEDMMKAVFPLLLKTDNTIVNKITTPQFLYDISELWIAGVTYVQIQKYCEKTRILIVKRRKSVVMSLPDVINFCDNFLGYDCTLVLSAIIENVNYYCDDVNINQLITHLAKRMRYGLVEHADIVLYEMGFNDRIIAIELAQILNEEYQVHTKKEIMKLIKSNPTIRNNVQQALEKYPSYFEQKWEELCYF